MSYLETRKMTSLRVLCPQEYGPDGMQITNCTRCTTGWSKQSKRCTIETGAEHLPLAAAPDCPIQDVCQHQLQSNPSPCQIRARGLICESALRNAGIEYPEDHPLSFNATTIGP